MISVLLVEDNVVFRDSLQYLLETTTDIQIVAAASNGVEAVVGADSYCPDVTVMDVSMPLMDGLEATRQIHVRCPGTHVMMLSMFENQEYIQRALEVGAIGYVLKDTAGEDLLTAIYTVAEGHHYFSPKIARKARKFINKSNQVRI